MRAWLETFRRWDEISDGLAMGTMRRGHVGDPWDLACLVAPLTRPDLQKEGQTVVGKAFIPLISPALVLCSSVFFSLAVLSYPGSSSIGVLLFDVENVSRMKDFRVLNPSCGCHMVQTPSLELALQKS